MKNLWLNIERGLSMKIEVFKRCFNELCYSFDLEPEKKKNRLSAYYSSKLGELREDALLTLINTAKETLDIRPGFLPPIRQLINLYYTATTNYNKTELMTDRENFHDAICPICGNIGFVILEHEGYTYSGFCCTCSYGQKKQHETKLGQKLGCYVDWLSKGYSMPDGAKQEKDELPDKVPF